jgi:hypothetical protein
MASSQPSAATPAVDALGVIMGSPVKPGAPAPLELPLVEVRYEDLAYTVKVPAKHVSWAKGQQSAATEKGRGQPRSPIVVGNPKTRCRHPAVPFFRMQRI